MLRRPPIARALRLQDVLLLSSLGALALSACECGEDLAALPGSVVGNLCSIETGKPLAGHTVKLDTLDEVIEVETDQMGESRLDRNVKLFGKATGCRVAIINDAAAAAIAEMRFGAGRGFMGKALLLTLGTGIGSGLFLLFYLLVTPGILTDFVGFSLLIPPLRSLVKRGVAEWIRRNIEVRVSRAGAGFLHDVDGLRSQRDEVIDAKVIKTHVEVSPTRLLAAAKGRRPYLHSSQQIADLFKAALAIQPRGSLRPHTYATLLGLMASTGIRIGEAIRLKNCDVE